MLSYKKAIFPLLVGIFALLFELSVSAQCGPGKISRVVQGYASLITTDNSYNGITGPSSLGVPDGNGTYFSNNGQYIIIDLLDTVRVGQTYSFIWRQFPGIIPASQIWWSESIDGVTFYNNSHSGFLSTTNEEYFQSEIIAENDTRFIRVFINGTNDFNLDAVSYYATKCYSDLCGAGYTSQLISGNAIYSAGNSINDPTYANIGPDGRGAFLNSTTDFARFRVPNTIPAGQPYYIIWRADQNGAQIRIRESSDGSTWSGYKYTVARPSSALFSLHIETTGIATNYIEISPANSYDLYLDALVYNAMSCDLAAPDLDVEGSYTYCGSQIYIAPGLTIGDPYNQIITYAYVQIGNGFQAGQDILSITPEYGITATYNSTHGLLVLKGTATTSQYQSVLRSLIFRNTNPVPVAGNREIIVSLERYHPGTNHYYRYVGISGLTWHSALLYAARTYLYGMQGYLVNITSAAENSFLISQMTGGAIWTGASDFYSSEGDWKWMTGPESGTSFWSGDENGTELTYANWNAGEPNDDGNQDYCHFLSDGTWDDNGFNLGSGIYRPDGYYVEFGGISGDPEVDLFGIVNVIIDDQPPSLVGIFPEGQSDLNLCFGSIPAGPSTASIAALYSDNCGGPITVTKSGTPTGNDCAWTVTYTYTVRDWRSNYVTVVPSVMYSGGDMTAPVLVGTFPTGQTNMNLCFTSIPAGPAIADIASLYTDNCGGPITVTKTGTPTGTDCSWSVTYTYTVRDKCNNYVTTVPSVTYTGGDTEAPQLAGVLPGGAVGNVCYADRPAAPLATDIALLYTDNCSTPTASLTSTDVTGDNCSWSVKYTYTVTDGCNAITAEVTYTGGDTEAPTFIVPVEITICRDINGNINRDPSLTGTVTNLADNCSNTFSILYEDSDEIPSEMSAGYITRKWSVIDECGNPAIQYQTIWVQPVPRISVTVPDTLFCNGSTVEFTIDSLVVSRGEVMYDLDVTYPADLSGTLTDGQNQIINISDLLTNNSDSYQTAIYRFRPYIQGKTGDPTCHDGVEVIIAVHVEPTARVALTLSDNELCNGESVNIQIATPTTAYNGLEFNVEAINSYPEITGFTDRTGLIVTDIITEALSNSGDTARLVTYVVAPATLDVSGNQKCYGIRDTVRVWVNPTPRATPENYAPHICYGGTTDVVLLSPTVMSSGINEFNYTITSTASTAVVAGNRTALNSQAPGTHLQFPYTNESDTMQSVFFRITPKVTGPGCPYGPPVISEIKVHPHPLQSLEILDSITCDGGQDGALQVIYARGFDSLWVAWTGPDYWEEAAYNMFIAEECSQGYYTATVTDSLGCSSSDALNFLAPSIEVSLYFGQFISCPGAEDARMVVALTEGHAPPYYYSLVWNSADTVYQGWMPPEGTFFSLDNLKPGEYLLTVVDANGCREELPRTLYDAPVTFAGFEKSLYADDNISCESYSDGTIRVSEIYSYYMEGADTVFVSSRAPYTYLWSASNGGIISGSPTDSLLVNIPAGTYTLTVTDSQGCIFNFTETMTEPDGIDLIDEEVSLSNDGNYEISCYGGSDGFINLQFDGGTGAYGYAWTGPDGFTSNTQSLTGIGAGTYNLTVTDGNMCHREYTYILDEPDSLSIAVSTSHTPDNAFNIGCNGGDGTIDITVSGGSGAGTYSYQWTKSADQSYASNLEDLTVKAGTYLLQVTDVNGCVNTRTVEITEPDSLSLSLAVSDITCLNAPAYNDGSIDLTVSGGRPPYSYSWTGPAGFTSSLEDISALTEGTYTITVTDSYGCSIASDTFLSLPEPISLEPRISDYNGFSISCLGKSDGWLRIIPQTGTAPYSYSWSGPAGFTATTDSIYSLREGTYSVIVTDAHLCSVTQDITLVSPGQLSMTLSIGLSNGGSFNINCNGASSGRVNVTAVNAAGTPEYIWSDGLSGAARDNLTAGYHEVILTDANGCIADTSLTLTEPDSLRISFALISPYCPESNDGSIFAGVTGGEGAYTFTWSDGQTTQEAVGLVQGLYTVEARDFNGCVLSDSLLLKPTNDICVGIPNAFSPDGDGINEFWNITRISFYNEAEVIILNRWGEIVWKSEKGYPDPWDGRASNGKVLPMDSYHYAIDLHNGEKPIVGHVTIIR